MEQEKTKFPHCPHCENEFKPHLKAFRDVTATDFEKGDQCVSVMVVCCENCGAVIGAVPLDEAD